MDSDEIEVTITVDRQLLAAATSIFAQQQLSMNAAVTGLMAHSVLEQRVPYPTQLTDTEQARLALLLATAQLPVEDLTDPVKLKAWLDDPEQDY